MMRSLAATVASVALALTGVLAANTTTAPAVGYGNITSTLPANSTFSFGSNYAILNLDLINGIVGSINGTSQGQTLINNTVRWVSAVQAKPKVPLTIWTRIYFSNAQRPELGVGVPFSGVAGGFGNITEASPTGELYPAFKPLSSDVVLPKTRFYAGAGNSLELILSAYKIDTVILSGIRTSGVILATTSHLYDLDYNVYVISDNVIETAPDNGINKALLEGVFPKITGVNVISLDQALGALSRSG